MMDFAQLSVEMTPEQEMISTRKRLETFQFRRTTNGPSPSAQTNGRPHSRNGSVTSVSLSSSSNSLPSAASELAIPSSGSRPSSLTVPVSRPVSHHRRRSSVSTRVESAEIMGVALPDLPSSSSNDNINFGDRDSIRRRALLALEGSSEFRPSNNTVEIPELSGQGVLQKPSEPKLPMPNSSFGGISSSLSGKRDSFGKFLSSANSLKDQLHTLMEEEEEEDEDEGEEQTLVEHKAGSAAPPAYKSVEATGLNFRHRPANLTLRPLSLALSASSPGLPTPDPTPSPRPVLRALSLTTSSEASSVTTPESIDLDWMPQPQREMSLTLSSLPSFSSTESPRRQMSGDSSSGSSSPGPKRHSSISYIRSGSTTSPPTSFTAAGLPTPGATPTSEKRQSSSSISSFGSVGGRDRRNVSEEMFLSQSHASLLARITELERALHSRSRPVSTHSDTSTDPPDEMLQLVADLKAERDELNSDVDGWRQRVKDLEHARTVLGRRLEAEKREAWLKTEKLGLLEVEKGTLDRQLKVKEEEVSSISRRLETTQVQLRQALQECAALKEDADVAKRQLNDAQSLLQARKGVEIELYKVRDTLATEQAYREQLIRQLDEAGILETPRVTGEQPKEACKAFNIQARSKGIGFMSIDSACTTVDSEEEGRQALKAPFTLKAVEEESDERDDGAFEEDDELARYEDEDASDLSFTSPTRSASSFDEDLPRSLSHFRLAANSTPVPSRSDVPLSSRSLSPSPSPSSSPCPTPVPLPSPVVQSVGHVNRCFAQQDVDISPRRTDTPSAFARGAMDSQSLFSQRLQFVDTDEQEDMPPFVLPAQKKNTSAMLNAVMEENEDGDGSQSEAAEEFTFPISVSEDTLSRMSPTPYFEESVQESSVTFVFPQMKGQQSKLTPAKWTA
ncbi:hypothetical protein DFH11DRAFT_1874644 [Phellopilus nigrolimitatus]|nr:hypothetical protein DFH11DRAFT_1874644 [Phellopilus nigrolimitatus]